MKKLINLFGAIGLTASTSTLVVSCENKEGDDYYPHNFIDSQPTDQADLINKYKNIISLMKENEKQVIIDERKWFSENPDYEIEQFMEFKRNSPSQIMDDIYDFLQISYEYKIWSIFDFNESKSIEFMKKEKLEINYNFEEGKEKYDSLKDGSFIGYLNYISDSTLKILEAIYKWGIQELGWKLS